MFTSIAFIKKTSKQQQNVMLRGTSPHMNRKLENNVRASSNLSSNHG